MLKPDFTIILSRTDSIGDVVLTLPMCGFIKKQFPKARIIFLGRTYTKDIIALSQHVDGFINYDELEKLEPKTRISELKKYGANVIVHVFPQKQIAVLAKAANIQLRVGTTNRAFHWLYCNKLIKLSRKNSALHESQLNIKLLSFLNINVNASLPQISKWYGFNNIPQLLPEYKKLVDKNRYNVILHPKSKGSAKEWGHENFEKLIQQLPEEKFKIFVSGTQQDGDLMKDFLARNSAVTNLTGQLSLSQFIAFIGHCQALVAASTGPLHIAAAMGKNAIGLFSPKRPIHPGRWMPVGSNAHALVYDAACKKCSQGKDCDCITRINPQQIVDLLKA